MHHVFQCQFERVSTTRRKRLTRAEQQAETRRRLLEAAEEVFRRRGFSGSSVEEIVAAGRVQPRGVLPKLRQQGGAFHRSAFGHARVYDEFRRMLEQDPRRSGSAREQMPSQTPASWRAAMSTVSGGCSSCGSSAWRMRPATLTSPPCPRRSGGATGASSPTGSRASMTMRRAAPDRLKAPRKRAHGTRHRARGAELVDPEEVRSTCIRSSMGCCSVP